MTQSVQPEVGTASVNGTQLYYETLGEGHPLVLIHGGYMDRRMWDGAPSNGKSNTCIAGKG